MSQTYTDFTTDYPCIADLPESDRYRLLVAERRRLALTVLADETTPVELADLATSIATREEGSDRRDEESVERIEITLHHRHLPKMDDLGVIDYDSDTQRITR